MRSASSHIAYLEVFHVSYAECDVIFVHYRDLANVGIVLVRWCPTILCDVIFPKERFYFTLSQDLAFLDFPRGFPKLMMVTLFCGKEI